MNGRIKDQRVINSKSSCASFGPQILRAKIASVKNIRKLIHYDCNNAGEDEDIPNEDEVYIKENLLERKLGDDISE